MRKSKFSESQIVAILKQADAGVAVKDLCRQAGISSATYYQWKSTYGGMDASDLKRVRELEAENARLKRLYAELALDNAAMKDLIAKKNSRAGAEARGCAVPHRGPCTAPAPVLQSGRLVPFRVVRAAAGLDRAGRRADRCPGATGRGQMRASPARDAGAAPSTPRAAAGARRGAQARSAPGRRCRSSHRAWARRA